MKHGSSLEQERQALLEQIHASRQAYRRLLTEADAEEFAHETNALYSDPAQGFPRSMTVRWIMQHPYLCASIVIGAVVLIGPGRIGRTVRDNRATLMTTMAAAGSMAVRHRPALQKYARGFSVLAGFIQARRAKKAARRAQTSGYRKR
jgi:hypothetical protein